MIVEEGCARSIGNGPNNMSLIVLGSVGTPWSMIGTVNVVLG